VSSYGEGSIGALGWKTKEGQIARFEMLSQIGNMNSCSVMDIGCGFGDLKPFLDEKFTDIRYAGIDHDDSFLEIAVNRHGGLPNTTFYLGDFWTASLPNMDYVLASGALSYRNSDPDFIYAILTRIFSFCRLGFAFNMLCSVEPPNGILAAYHPEVILDFCKTITPATVLKQGYYQNDFTIFMLRAE
jgi:trans-aconitate methyltransferase